MRPAFSFVACLVLSVGAAVSSAFAEKIELVTYYPTSAVPDDLHVRSLTVGNSYKNIDMTPPERDGQALVFTQIGIGTPVPAAGSRLHVVGAAGQASSVVFMPGAGASSELRMGIGTAAPAYALDVAAANGARVSVNGQSGIYLNTPNINAGNEGLALGFNRVYNGTNFANTGYIQAESQGVGYRNIALNPLGGNVGIGRVNPQGPAPNGQAGNLDVNDIWLRAANAGGGKWLSQTPQVVETKLATNTTFTTSESVIGGSGPSGVKVIITTHGGPLLIQGKAWIQRPAGPSHAEIRIRRMAGGGPFGQIIDGWRWFSDEPTAGRGMTAVVFGTETLPAGTYGYVLTGQCDGGATWNVINSYTKLIVTEL